MRRRKSKPAATSNPDFEAVQHWYQVEFANYCFEVVRDSIPMILEKGKGGQSLEYYVMTVGLICTYTRPFTNNKPVGELDDEIVPEEFKDLHSLLIQARDQLFAHGDAFLEAAPGEYPNEAVIAKDGKVPSMHVSRSAMKPETFERMLPLSRSSDRKDELLPRKISKEICQRHPPASAGTIPIKRRRSQARFVYKIVGGRRAGPEK